MFRHVMLAVIVASAGPTAVLLAAGGEPPTTQAVNRVQKTLAADSAEPGELLPGLSSADPSKLRDSGIGQAILAAVGSEPPSIPVTTYTQYRAFRHTGDREPYQTPYFEKRRMLAREVLAAWLLGETGSLDRINDLLWNICEETNWVIPAHESVGEIDLMAAETGADLAVTDLLIGARLPEEIRARVRGEVRRRIIEPYLDHGQRFWWDNGANNWTGVCAGSMGQVLFVFEPDPERQARGIALVIDQLDRFIARAFEEDGASTEGIGYWNYGLAHFVIFAEMLAARTGGEIDLLAGEKIAKIAAYPSAVALGRNVFASFSDSKEHGSVLPFLAARMAERTGRTELLALAGDKPADGRLGWVLCNLLWHGDRPAPEFALDNTILPQAGVGKRVAIAAGRPVVLIAKAGSNAEQHNHNDVGSFILRVGDTTFLCDPGAGLYNAAYFGAKRYDNIFASSYGHSVPRIAGRQQLPGGEHRGTLQLTPNHALQIDFARAYGSADLTGLKRTLALRDDGTVTLTDEFRFAGDGGEVEEAFLTWQEVRAEGSVARLIGSEGTLELRAEEGTFSVEVLDQACKDNRVKGILKRITVTYPAQSARRAHFTMTYRPGT